MICFYYFLSFYAYSVSILHKSKVWLILWLLEGLVTHLPPPPKKVLIILSFDNYCFLYWLGTQVDGDDYKYESSETERLHFVKFETKYIEQCLNFIRDHLVNSKESMAGKSIKATGGGAYKYADLIYEKLGLA